jgi:hypothetical protein
MTADVDTTNDFVPAPFSDYYDVDGTDDIGASSGVRRSTTYIDDTGTINYSTVDATTTLDIPYFLRTGDTVNIAAGSYRAFSVNSSNATSSITIQGAGVSTIIGAQTGENALLLTNVSSTTISDMWVRNASSVGSASYTITRINGLISSTSYNEGVPDGSGGYMIPPDVTLIIPDAVCSSPSFVSADGTDITSFTDSGTTNFHLALVNIHGISCYDAASC